ncbi:cytochrome-c peroxidase [Dyadobacter frigoris]|uniref:Cytochrome-c peroxidase n=1 Tax=Dyadobacter frigoris TaxID=2576211 RepID=A0A4U6D8Q0_9BACT|nr:cytochrome-c peroxidase [Dyadobacter frigoris]
MKVLRFSVHTRTFHQVLTSILLLLLFGCQTKENTKTEAWKPTPLKWTKPTNFPDPVYNLSKNPLTEEGVALGKTLFYDQVLSKTNQISCASCHLQKAAFSHQGQSFSLGIHGQLSKRNSPAIQNMAWNPVFFWDGGVHDLDFVPFNPVQNPVEMGENVSNVIEKIKKVSDKKVVNYPKMFKAAFGTGEINSIRMMKALSQFMVTMVSADSPYDQYVAGNDNALRSEQKEGLTIFKKNCASCHAGELFTNYSFKNNGLAPLKANDTGRFDVTRLDKDKYKFKVPGLRNIGFTAPYMHDGRFKTLEEVLDHYSGNVIKSETLDPILIQENGETGINLSKEEKKKVITFLKSLDDQKFLENPTLASPKVSAF